MMRTRSRSNGVTMLSPVVAPVYARTAFSSPRASACMNSPAERVSTAAAGNDVMLAISRSSTWMDSRTSARPESVGVISSTVSSLMGAESGISGSVSSSRTSVTDASEYHGNETSDTSRTNASVTIRLRLSSTLESRMTNPTENLLMTPSSRSVIASSPRWVSEMVARISNPASV